MKLAEDLLVELSIILLQFGTLGMTQDYAQAEPALQRVLLRSLKMLNLVRKKNYHVKTKRYKLSETDCYEVIGIKALLFI